MSTIGTLHIAPSDLLAELQTASSSPGYLEFLIRRSAETLTYEWDGYVLATLLPVLDNQYAIKLMRSHSGLVATISRNSGTTQFILTQSEKDDYLDRLAPHVFSAEELQRAYEAFNQTHADGVGEVMLEGVSFLRSGLRQVSPSTIAVLTIS